VERDQQEGQAEIIVIGAIIQVVLNNPGTFRTVGDA
jgi:hypothetical protein